MATTVSRCHGRTVLLALEDKDEQVRAKALALLVQDRAREQAAKK